MKTLLLAASLAIGLPDAVVAQAPAAGTPVTGDAVAGLVSRTATAEVHLLTDRKLSDHRLVLKVVVLNRTGAAVPFGPDAVTVAAADGSPVPLIERAVLLAQLGGAPGGPRETSNAHETATLPTANAAGQQDVTGFSGGMGMTTAGVPTAALDRSRPAGDPAAQARLDAVLLKPGTIPAGAADGGQLFTRRLDRKLSEVTVRIAFAGETHLFKVAVPK